MAGVNRRFTVAVGCEGLPVLKSFADSSVFGSWQFFSQAFSIRTDAPPRIPPILRDVEFNPLQTLGAKGATIGFNGVRPIRTSCGRHRPYKQTVALGGSSRRLSNHLKVGR
jgi:hypothetical protein